MADNNAVLEGTIEGITGFGAFVKLDDGRKGLVHISEVARGYVREIGDHVAVGDRVKVKLLDEDENGRLRLSIKQALPEEEHIIPQANFDDILSKFIKQSEERQLDLKRNIRKKSGSGGKGRH